MKAEYRNRWMVWVIVTLALLNITTLITAVYHKGQVTDKEVVATSDSMKSENASVLNSGRYFRDRLNLSRDQMDRFVEFNPEFRQKARSINIDLERVRHLMLTEMAAKNSDNNKLDMLSDSIGYLHANLKKLTYMYYLDIKSICDQQQQKILEHLFGEIFTSDLHLGQYGKGNPNGRRYGRRINN